MNDFERAARLRRLFFGGRRPPRSAVTPDAAGLVWRGLKRVLEGTLAPSPEPVAEPAPLAPAPSRPSFALETHAHGEIRRAYRLYVPSRPAASPALVVLLHGCTQDAADFAAGTRVNEAAERDGFLVLYPQQSRDANPSLCWNWFDAGARRGGGEIALIADLTRRVVATHGVDPRRVYVAGLSAGGAMAASVAAAHPALYAAVGIHSGLPAGAAGNLPDALAAMRSGARRTVASTVPVVVFHGDADRTVHPRNADAVVAAVAGTTVHATRSTTEGAGGARFTRTDHVAPDGATIAEQWVLHGAGHAWAGGSSRGTYTDPAGVDATAAMLRFFEAHRH